MTGRIVGFVASVVLVVAGCAGGDGSVAPATQEAPTPSTSAPIEQPKTTATNDPADPVTNDSAGPVTAETVPPTTVPAATTPPLAIDVGRTVEQTTSVSGNPPTPVLAWEPVDGASSYIVIVANSQGSTWWSWEGTEVEVTLGGVATGPAALRTEIGVTWTVLAQDGGGGLIAASSARPLDP